MTALVRIEFKRLSTTAVLPTYATDGAAGMDLVADENWTIQPNCRQLVKINIAIALPAFYEAQVRPRSGLALKHGITVLNSPGTIDPDYRGGIGVILLNTSTQSFTVTRGDRIAQLVIAPIFRASFTEVDSLDETVRGEGGFGSTGLHRMIEGAI